MKLNNKILSKLFPNYEFSLYKGVLTFRQGYYWQHLTNLESFKNRILKILDNNHIQYSVLDYGDHFVAKFRGSATTKNSSHLFVKIQVL